ncbi:MAG TPA: alpha/beta hydrolase [Acidimicrobiales bacterium]|jgi:pimeloyl-ACP methyl ester carboxylesterase|nr:alpha/beta hydrolase [Acidimicrobiales bacterium]
MTREHGLAVTEHVPEGRSRSPTVVLIHGSLDRSTSFARVVRRLPDLRTVVYDRRGYNRSRAALPLHDTFDGHVDDLLSVIDDRPAVVVGHSYGGDVALAAALRPESRNSILAAAAYEPPMPWLAEYRSAPDAAPRGSAVDGDPADPDDAAAAAERFFRRMVGDTSWERLPESAKADRRADGPALATELRAIRLAEAPFDVTKMPVPTTYGRGGNSASRHRRAVAWLLEHTPGSELFEIGGASHGAHLTHPDAFATMVRSAVARARWPAELAP